MDDDDLQLEMDTRYAKLLINDIDHWSCILLSRPNIVDLMRKSRLPPHIIQCFVVSGFDEIESVLEMDASEGPTNCIDVIERYINDRKMHYPQCMDPNQPREIPFEMSPGHRIRVKKFVVDMKQRYGSKKKMRTGSSACRPLKKQKRDSEKDSEKDEPNEIGIVEVEIRKKIIKWSHENKKELKENEDFTIQVRRNVLDQGKLEASIRCKCGGIQKIQQKTTGVKPWQLSNWTKHYKLCVASKRQSGVKQGQLNTFFPIVQQEKGDCIPSCILPPLSTPVLPAVPQSTAEIPGHSKLFFSPFVSNGPFDTSYHQNMYYSGQYTNLQPTLQQNPPPKTPETDPEIPETEIDKIIPQVYSSVTTSTSTTTGFHQAPPSQI